MKNKGLLTFVITFTAFAITYIMLVISSHWSNTMYILTGILLGILAILSFIMAEMKRKKEFISNIWGILGGLFLWGFIGEFLEAIKWVEIAHYHFFPVLLILVLFFVFLVIRKELNERFALMFGHFFAIWGLHMWMIFQFNYLSNTHWSTYFSSVMAGIGAIIVFLLARRSNKLSLKMAYAVTALLLAWSVLEYVWGWRLIPGPYSIQ